MSGMKSAIDTWVKDHMKLDVVALRAATGLRGKPLLDKYKGEETGGGWRTGQMKDGLQHKTDYFDPTRKSKSEVQFDKDGTATSDGAKLGDKLGQEDTFGYVIDPETAKLHQFKEVETNTVDGHLSVHHSSPLGGKDVAGAGKIKATDGRITEINDQSGHYRPDGALTFQAVRQINLANMSQDIQARLRNQASEAQWTMSDKQTKKGKEGGGAEAPDTLEQLIATEIGKKRQEFFKALDKAQENELKKAYEIEDKQQQESQIEAINEERRSLADAFREVAKQTEKELRDGAGRSPLVSNRTVYSLEPELAQLNKALTSVEEQISSNQKVGDDTKDLEATAAKMRAELEYRGFRSPSNQEAKVSLLGKGGALTDEEYRNTNKDRDAFNQATALKQLVAPIGEEEFGKLVKAGKGAIQKAMLENSVDTVEKLKAALGQKKVDAIKGDSQEVERLSKEYGVKSLDKGFNEGPEMAAFNIGKATATTLTAQQFLQTGGNEAQISNKARLNEELTEPPPTLKKATQNERPHAPELGKVVEPGSGKPAPRGADLQQQGEERQKREIEISKKRRQSVDQLLKELDSDPVAKKKMLLDQLELAERSIAGLVDRIDFLEGEGEGHTDIAIEARAELEAQKKQKTKLQEAIANL